MRKLISVVAPMYNEEKLVHEYCKETLAVLGKIEEISGRSGNIIVFTFSNTKRKNTIISR